jgi:chromosome segregation protein
MRLQKLEISGFKSFPDRADLAFDRGVTAIVGPNGCGKSNVVDAITWVLGEQSAKSLRGERMEDVIFSGSDARKATAAAEVKLKLSGVVTRPPTSENGQPLDGFGIEDPSTNGHGDAEQIPLTRDVELARRLYRSGESEYLLDGHVCRLKDIQDLLMDVGIGVKGYAVIEQGKIGQILSAKPTDRRQLIEEAAGVTKFKSRRRAAELKLEAAQQNLTRIDDIVFELDKQRGALKRQAAKARRYRKLREELRQWEKLLFAQRYEVLGSAIHTAREKLAQTRERETVASARVAELEADLERLRIELAEADAKANALRADAHNRELENGRRQQQITFDSQQVDALAVSARDIGIELEQLEARRAPGLQELEARKEAAARADEERDRASEALRAEEQTQNDTQRDIAGLERAVETARGVVFAKLNAETTLKHAIERAEEARNRIADDIARLDVEAADLKIEIDRLGVDRERQSEDLRAGQEALEATHAARAASEAELGTARVEREWRVRDARALEREVAATAARVKSLEELEAARAAYGDAARLVLASKDHGITHGGSVADYLEVDRDFERVVEACFSDLLQYVIVHSTQDAERGLAFVRERNAGRCGFLIAASEPAAGTEANAWTGETGADTAGADTAGAGSVGAGAGIDTASGDALDGAAAAVAGHLSIDRVVRINGVYAAAVRQALGRVLIVDSFDEAASVSAQVGASTRVATRAGDVFSGGRLVTGGGGRDEGHGILVTKREIKELREKLAEDQAKLLTLTDDITTLDATISQAEQTIKAHEAERHRQEKSILQAELQVSRAKEELDRLSRRQELGANERRRFEDDRRGLEQRQEEARQSILKLADEHREAEAALAEAQQQLVNGRERLADIARRASEAKAVHAALVERASAIANEVRRLEDGARELDARIAGRADERARMETRREDLANAIVENQKQLDQDLIAFAELRQQVVAFEERVNEVQIGFQDQEQSSRGARNDLDTIRGEVTQLEIARATAESDLSHLAAVCQEALQMTLDEVASEVAALQAAGTAIPAAPVAGDEESAEGEEAAADEGEAAEAAAGAEGDETFAAAAVDADAGEDESGVAASAGAGAEGEVSAEGEAAAAVASATPTKKARAAAAPMSPEEAIAVLKKKIDRLGPVNMMAIEQFDELETRHAFLTTQRKDLLDSIAQTGEAIKRIEKTTRERFHEAFTTINVNFGEMFTTLFGGGRAGLVLLDESDALESGIDIIAQPPGKRLQNVQLLSGGEKALTAMALMFGIFRYRPSPFCLLDEIDAPLDDANIGRFVEMLRGMNDQTQFILITHHRKTMEIADRLYGVTMEEPGVSKLISLEMN